MQSGLMSVDFEGCLVPYEGHGVVFEYPDIWELDEERDGNDVLLTVSSESTCFWALRILFQAPPPPQVVESCVEAFREEYDDVEVEDIDYRLAEMPAYCRRLDFSCFELLNAVFLASVRTTDFTVLVWWQGTDHELQQSEQILERVTSSLRIQSLI
jgi:hypothetical protein